MVSRSALVVTLICWLVLHVSLANAQAGDSNVIDDRKPIDVPLMGAGAGGAMSLPGQGLVSIVGREYPGSAMYYEPGTPVRSLLRVLQGDDMLAMPQCTADLEAALNGGPPFPKKFSLDDFGVVARVVGGMIGAIYARQGFLDDHGINHLGDIKTKRVPLRLASSQLGNVSSISTVRTILAAYGMIDADIKRWGGKHYYVFGNLGIQMLKDNKVDMMIVLAFHPDARVVAMVRTISDFTFLPMGPEVVKRVSATLKVPVGTINASAYSFLEEDYLGPTIGGCYLLASKAADNLLTYKVAKALYKHFDYYRSLHPAFHNLQRERLPDAGTYRLHPGAAQFYREVGLTAGAE